MPTPGTQVEEWWNSSLQASTAENRSKVAAILIYTAWNVWNERNRRIFHGVSQSAARVMSLIKEEMDVQRQSLWGPGDHLVSNFFCTSSSSSVIYVRKSPVYTLQLLQKSDFQLSTTKSDNTGHPTVKTGKIWPLGWFSILWELKIFNSTLKNL